MAHMLIDLLKYYKLHQVHIQTRGGYMVKILHYWNTNPLLTSIKLNQLILGFKEQTLNMNSKTPITRFTKLLIESTQTSYLEHSHAKAASGRFSFGY